jgi:hypothetical protein
MNTTALHAELCSFTSECRTPSEGEQRTFVVLEFAETEDKVGGGIYIIDPAIPKKCTGSDLLQLTTARHCAMSMQNALHDTIKEQMDKVTTMRNMTDKLGLDNVLEALDSATNEEEFTAAMEKIRNKMTDPKTMVEQLLRKLSDDSPPAH